MKHPSALLALDSNDAQAALAALDKTYPQQTVWTLEEFHAQPELAPEVDPLDPPPAAIDYALDRGAVLYVTATLNDEPASLPFLHAVRSANATHQIRVLEADHTWRGGPKPDPTLPGPGRPAPSEEHAWIYVRGAGWWDGPWTIQNGRATDPDGTVVFLEHVAAWSDVPLAQAVKLPTSGVPAVAGR